MTVRREINVHCGRLCAPVDDHDLTRHGEQAAALRPVAERLVPQRFPGTGVERGQLPVLLRRDDGRGCEIQPRRLVHGAGTRAAAGVCGRVNATLGAPGDPAGVRVDRDKLAVGPLRHHDAVVGDHADQLRRPPAQRPQRARRRVHVQRTVGPDPVLRAVHAHPGAHEQRRVHQLAVDPALDGDGGRERAADAVQRVAGREHPDRGEHGHQQRRHRAGHEPVPPHHLTP